MAGAGKRVVQLAVRQIVLFSRQPGQKGSVQQLLIKESDCPSLVSLFIFRKINIRKCCTNSMKTKNINNTSSYFFKGYFMCVGVLPGSSAKANNFS